MTSVENLDGITFYPWYKIRDKFKAVLKTKGEGYIIEVDCDEPTVRKKRSASFQDGKSEMEINDTLVGLEVEKEETWKEARNRINETLAKIALKGGKKFIFLGE